MRRAINFTVNAMPACRMNQRRSAMDEAQWLSSADLTAMLAHVQGKVSDRRLRLFACACARQAWDRQAHPRNRRALEAAERFADGSGTAEEIQTGTWLSQRVYEGVRRAEGERLLRLVRLVGGPLPRPEGEDALPVPPADAGGPPALVNPAQAALLRCVAGDPFRPADIRWVNGHLCRLVGRDETPEKRRRRAVRSTLVLEKWQHVAWLTPAAAGMARRVYDEGDFSPAALGVLSDALEEAGCRDADVLRHLRGWARCPDCLGGGDGARVYCDGCAGMGWVPAGPPCPECGGTGMWERDLRPKGGPDLGPEKMYVLAPPDSIRMPCDRCAGAGRLPAVHAKGCHIIDLLTGRE
jgi:hypothetical protein